MKDKVIILGKSLSGKDATLDNDNFEIWGLNDSYNMYPIEKFNAWFEIHTIEEINKIDNHFEDLSKIKIPIYMQEHYDYIPYSIKYPKEEMLNKYGLYFTSTIAYMLALAIEKDFKEIHMYGVDLLHTEEYEQQRGAVEYFLGIAKGKDIKIVLPLGCPILKPFDGKLYGYEESIIKSNSLINQDMFSERMKLYIEDRKMYLEDSLRLDSAIKLLESLLQDDDLNKNKLQDMLQLYKQTDIETKYKYDVLDGCIKDCKYWISILQIQESKEISKYFNKEEYMNV